MIQRCCITAVTHVERQTWKHLKTLTLDTEYISRISLYIWPALVLKLVEQLCMLLLTWCQVRLLDKDKSLIRRCLEVCNCHFMQFRFVGFALCRPVEPVFKSAPPQSPSASKSALIHFSFCHIYRSQEKKIQWHI